MSEYKLIRSKKVKNYQ